MSMSVKDARAAGASRHWWAVAALALAALGVLRRAKVEGPGQGETFGPTSYPWGAIPYRGKASGAGVIAGVDGGEET